MNKSFYRWILQIKLLITGCLLASCAPPTVTVPTQPQTIDPIQAFEQKLEGMRKKLSIPGMSVAVLKDQKTVFAKGFGYADIEKQIPATENTPYNIASLTKPFGATVLMALVEEGRLNLDDAMAEILKDTHFQYGDHTAQGYTDLCKKIRRLAWRYGSLLRDYRCHTEKISVRHHLTHTSQGMPGETYRYNGFLYRFLSDVAQEASGKRFDELLVEKIISPLEMARTVPSITEKHRDQILVERAKYYRKGFLGGFVPSRYPATLSASAGMVSTVLDLAKFDVAMDRNLIVSEESKEQMFTPTVSNSGQTLPYGLGWFIQEQSGVKIVWHYGWAPNAYSSMILKVPDKKVTLVLLANSDGASAPFQLGEGNVFKSPFAVAFIDLFANMEVTHQ